MRLSTFPQLASIVMEDRSNEEEEEDDDDGVDDIPMNNNSVMKYMQNDY